MLTLTFVMLGLNAQYLEMGNSLVNFGAGMGTYMGSGNGYSSTIPPLYFTYEYMINDKISVGPAAAYHASKYEVSISSGFGEMLSVEYDFSYLHFGAVGNYHFYNEGNIDAYGGIILGYTKVSVDVSSSSSDDNTNLSSSLTLDSSGFLYGAQVGGRYFFNDFLAFNLEVGYGISIVRGGLTIKF